MAKEEKVFYVITHAAEDAERASIPFTLANAALAMDIKATLFLHGNGVFLAKKGYARHVKAMGFDPLKKLLDDFLELGGRLLVCVPCIKGRDIDASDLIEGAETTSGAKVTQEMLSAQVHLVY
jgi:uncharacterized protein